MKVIAISGWKGSGKDTVAGYLIQHHDFVRVSFADPLKDLVASEYGIDRTSLDDPKCKELALLNFPVNPQDAFSRMISEFLIKEFRDTHNVQPHSFCYQGNEFYGVVRDEEQGKDIKVRVYWTPRALAILKGSTNRSVDPSYWVKRATDHIKNLNKESIVITDLRYKSEMNQLKQAFSENIVFIRVNRFETSPSTDPSERDLDDVTFDFYIDNTSSIENSFSQMQEILAKL